MSSTRRLALVLSLVLLVAAVPATARAPPRAACAVCSDALDTAAAHDGYTLERADSRLVVDVAANGSTRWTAHVTIAEGADRLDNDTYREGLVADAMARGGAVANPTDVSSRFEGDSDTLVVTYRASDATERNSGVLLFTAFHADDPVQPFAAGGEGTVYAGADELVVRAPDGYEVSGTYGNATTSKKEVRWTGDAAGESAIDRSTEIAFTREDGDSLSWFRVHLARLFTNA